jgi:hypothetical protein
MHASRVLYKTVRCFEISRRLRSTCKCLQHLVQGGRLCSALSLHGGRLEWRPFRAYYFCLDTFLHLKMQSPVSRRWAMPAEIFCRRRPVALRFCSKYMPWHRTVSDITATCQGFRRLLCPTSNRIIAGRDPHLAIIVSRTRHKGSSIVEVA